MTENFSVYYDLVRLLKERKTPFISLSFNDIIPANVGLMITTTEELDKVDFEPMISITENDDICLLYTSPSPRDRQKSRMPSSA